MKTPLSILSALFLIFGFACRIHAAPFTALGTYVGGPDGNSVPDETNFETQYAAFTASMGQAPYYMDIFVDYSHPMGAAWLSNAQWSAWSLATAGKHPASSIIPIVSVGLADTPTADPGGGWNETDSINEMNSVAAGTYDSMYTGIAQAYKSNGFSTIYLRLGWEMNGNWEPWFATNDSTDAAAFVAAYQHVANVLHTYASQNGINLKMVWCPNIQNWTAIDLTTTYAGDSYVDVIAPDLYSPVYYNGDQGGTDFFDWSTHTYDATLAIWMANPVNREHWWDYPGASEWNYTGGWGMISAIAFAKAHNKPFGLSETGAGNASGSTTGPVDESAFPTYLANRLQSAISQGLSIVFVNVWDYGQWYYSNGVLPNEAAAWLSFTQTMGGSGPTISPTPTGLTAVPGNNSVTLSWTASPGATSYNIYRATSSGGPFTTALSTHPTASPFTDTGLTGGTSYYYEISSSNSAGTSANSTPPVSATPSNSTPTMLGAPIPFTAASQLGTNFWAGSTDNAKITWNSAGNDVTVADNVVKTGMVYNPNSTGASGNHPGTAGGTPQSTYTSVAMEADVSFDYLGSDGGVSDSFGFYTNVNSAGTAGFIVLMCPQNSTSFDVRIGGEANPTVSGGSAASTPPNPSGATFGTGYWLNAPSGANVGQLATLNSGSTFSTGTFYTVELIETQNTTADTISYQVNIYTLAGTLMGSFNSGTITGVNTGYNQAGQVGLFTYDKSTSGAMYITDFAVLPGTDTVLPFDAATDLENNFWAGATDNSEVTWNSAGCVNVSYNVTKTAWVFDPSVTPGTGNHPATAGGSSPSTFSNVTIQYDVAFDAMTADTSASDSFGFYTNVNAAGTAGFVVVVCPQNSTSFDVRIGGEATPTVSGGSAASTPPNPSTGNWGTGYWLNAAPTAPSGPLGTLSGTNTLSTGTYYTVQLVETQNTAADTIVYQVSLFTTGGTLLGTYNSGTITGVGSAYNQAGQVGVFTYDKTTTGTTHIQNLIIDP